MRAIIAALAVLIFLPSTSLAQSLGAVTGAVASTNRVLLSDADVNLEGVGSTSTDSQGQFTFSNVSPGNYRLTVSKSGFPPFTRAVSVRAGMTERVEVILAGIAQSPALQGDSVAVPLMRVGNNFFVRAVLNGQRQALFMVDTGASITTISRAVAQELGIAMGSGAPTLRIVTASGQIEAPIGSVASIEVSGAEARDVQVAIFDLPQAGQVVGLLGNTFLSRFQVQLDAARGVLVLGR